MKIEKLYELYLLNQQVETDTRKLQNGDIFFALSGPNYNGNAFALQALEAGASYAVVDEAVAINEKIIVVENVLQALQDLAKYHREKFSIPFIAITGSNGKTTTKELVHAVLSTQFKTYTTEGNLNNHIGIPLTLLRVKKDAEMAVIEMGANHQKEIEGYCKYVQPTHGIITNCGKAHLEGFGGMEGVKKGKGELFDFLRDNDGTAFIYTDAAYLEEMSKGIKNIITYGSAKSDVSGEATGDKAFLQVRVNEAEKNLSIQTNLVGNYNLPNVLCAVAIGKHFNIQDENIISALQKYMPDNSRSQMVKIGSNNIILDAYNANPTSMKAAIVNMVHSNAENKILVLGAMMEMGDVSDMEHRALVELISSYEWFKVILVGKEFSGIAHPYTHFYNVHDASKWYNEQAFTDCLILIKGSRSQQMEKILG